MMRALAFRQILSEGRRHRCVGRASNPVGGAMRRWVGSTPIPLRHEHSLVYCAGASRRCSARCIQMYGFARRANLSPPATAIERLWAPN